MRDRQGKTFVLAGACLAIAAGACDRAEVTHYRVPKAASPPLADAHDSGAMPAMPASADLSSPPARAEGGLRWTLPKGWTEAPGGAMRFATFKPPVPGKIDASVVVLPGPAGGELANVNRWRGQIGLPPLDEAALSAARKVLQTRAGPVKLYDFTSDSTPKNRLVAGLTEAKGNTWFVKMTGDASAVGAARSDFMKLLGSLRFE